MKKFYLFIILFGPIASFAQENLQLSYDYEDRFGYENKSELYIKGNESCFQIKETRKNGIFTGPQKTNQDLANNQLENSILKIGEPYMVYSDQIGKIFYSSFENEYLRFPSESLKEIIYEHNVRKKYEWKVTNVRKKIGNYQCIKATCQKNGRNYTAWFSLNIPTNKGPLLMNGLPGAIVELIEDDGLCSLRLTKVQSLTDLGKFQEIKQYFIHRKVITYDAYEKFTRKAIVNGKAMIANRLPSIKKEFQSKKLGESLQISIEPKYFYERILDIPENIDQELKKIELQ